MEKLYMIGEIPNYICKKYSLPNIIENIYIDSTRFNVLKKSYPLFCLDKAPYIEHGSIILFHQYYYKKKYHNDYISLIDYMITNSIYKMKIDVVAFVIINNAETGEVLFNQHAVSGYFKLDNILLFNKDCDALEDVFYPVQKRKFFLQKNLVSKDINAMFNKNKKVSPYDVINYLLHQTMIEGEGRVVSHSLLNEYCKGNQKIELF